MDGFQVELHSTSVDLSCPSTVSKPLRLRNSCHHCSYSKLKCSQDRPTCSRCAKRGIACEYFVAKPGGRKPRKRSTDVTAAPTRGHSSFHPEAGTRDVGAYNPGPLMPQTNWYTTSVSASKNNSQPTQPPIMKQPTGRPAELVIQELFVAPDQVTPSSSSTAALCDIGDDFSVKDWCDSDMADMADMGIFELSDMLSSGVDGSTNHTNDTNTATTTYSQQNYKNDNSGSESQMGVVTALGNAASGLFAISTEDLTTQNMEAAEPWHPDFCTTGKSPSNSCLVQALRSLEHVSSVPRGGLEAPGHSTTPATKTIIAQTQLAVQSVGSMLRCACANDAYLLVIIPLLLFKVLDLYAAVARTQALAPDTSAAPPSASPTTYRAASDQLRHGEANASLVSYHEVKCIESARTAAQLVLRELYLVRRVVEQLSTKLKEKTTVATTGSNGVNASGRLQEENGLSAVFSAALQSQLVADALSSRVRALSTEIISQLKRL